MSAVTVNKILDGSRNAIIHVHLNDGSLGEVTDYVLLDPQTDFSPRVSRLTVEEILYDFAGFNVVLGFDSGLLDSNVVWVLPEGGKGYADFKPFGGLKDQSGLDGTGKLTISTTGFTTAAAKGSMMIKVRKS